MLLVSNTLATAGAINAIGQGFLFAAVVCIPLYKTGRMAYVDIGWPWGIIVIGLVAIFVLDGYWLRNFGIGLVYLFVGGRMGFMAVQYWRRGALQKELPRYAYQRRRWEKTGKTNTMLAAQSEVIAQGAFNASFLAFPAFIIAANTASTISLIEVLGMVVWLMAFVFETVADRQKQQFIHAQKRTGISDAVCDVGLWAYSRHPNYFGQWMGWNGVLLATVPSWLALYGSEHIVVWLALGAGSLLVSYFMYNTLVYYSGAVPSEYYSVRKRPAFAAYQQTTSRFFPRARRG